SSVPPSFQAVGSPLLVDPRARAFRSLTILLPVRSRPPRPGRTRRGGARTTRRPASFFFGPALRNPPFRYRGRVVPATRRFSKGTAVWAMDHGGPTWVHARAWRI